MVPSARQILALFMAAALLLLPLRMSWALDLLATDGPVHRCETSASADLQPGSAAVDCCVSGECGDTCEFCGFVPSLDLPRMTPLTVNVSLHFRLSEAALLRATRNPPPLLRPPAAIS